MNNQKTYSEKLRSPLWQRKRLEIMGRDLFACQKCGDKDNKTLHVHHRHYLPGREPWDYPHELLVTLCETCHQQEESCANLGPELINTLHFWGYFNTEIRDELNKLIEVRIAKSKAEKLSNPTSNQ